MSFITWLIKMQWGYTVDHLTYEKGWSIDRVSNLIIGVINTIIVTMAVIHSVNWLIPLAIFNVSVFISSVTGTGLLNGFLTRLGFQEKEKILKELRIQIAAKERIKKKIADCQTHFTTSNESQVFIFDSLETKTENFSQEQNMVFENINSN